LVNAQVEIELEARAVVVSDAGDEVVGRELLEVIPGLFGGATTAELDRSLLLPNLGHGLGPDRLATGRPFLVIFA
jgi:hypothetical protein